MLRWGLLLLALTQAPAENVVVTKLVMEAECHIPAAPPCISFNDPRWKVEGCKIDDGACFALGVEQAPHPVVSATIRISPKCKDKESKSKLLESAVSMLFKTKYELFTFKEKMLKCSKSGYADVRLNVRKKRD
jgi:hypothetical protein